MTPQAPPPARHPAPAHPATSADFHLVCSGQLSRERQDWLGALLHETHERPLHLHIHLAGDAPYALSKPDSCFQVHFTRDTTSIAHPFALNLDSDSLRVAGLAPLLTAAGYDVPPATPGSFWPHLVDSLALDPGTPVGVLHNTGPYMNRDSVHMLALLEAIAGAGGRPELYCYLDGVHLANTGQRPSEFLNVGAGLEALGQAAGEFPMRACSRCATARGYVAREDEHGQFLSRKVIAPCTIVNLNRIIDRFERAFPIFSLPLSGCLLPRPRPSQAGVSGDQTRAQDPPALLVLVTHPPYSSEWAFGAVSFALAAQNHGIPTQVVFIEDGVYGLVGQHHVVPADRIFNIQDVIFATADEIEYYAYAPSLAARAVDHAVSFPGAEEITRLDPEEFARLVLETPARPPPAPKRLITF